MSSPLLDPATGAAFPPTGNSATGATYVQILSGSGASVLSESLWTDDTGAFFVRLDNGTSITWNTVSGGASSAPGTGARPAAGTSAIVDRSSYQALNTGTGYTAGDLVEHVITTDPATGAILGFFWINSTAGTKISAPSSADITPLQPLPTGAATAANQTTGNTSLASILAKIVTSPALDGTDATGVTQVSGGVGIRGWLSSIYSKLSASIAVTGTFWQATQPISGTVTANLGTAAVTNAGTFAVQATEADGANTTLGAKADAAAGTGTVSAIALLKQLHLDAVAPTPTGSNLIGQIVATTITWTQTTVTLSAATSAPLIAANGSRKKLRWMVTGSNPMTVAPGSSAAVANVGMNYNGSSASGYQGGSDSFDGDTATGAFQAISTLGTTVTVWEGV